MFFLSLLPVFVDVGVDADVGKHVLFLLWGWLSNLLAPLHDCLIAACVKSASGGLRK